MEAKKETSKPKAAKKPEKAKNEKTIKITLIHSAICTNPKQRATLKALGLRKINQTKVMPDNDAIRGMIFVVKHLIRVEE